MPDDSDEPVVTTLVCFILFRTRGCGCIERPAFPAPSDVQKGRDFLEKLARASGENTNLYLDVIARSAATKQSSFLFAVRKLDCFACARNDGLKLAV
jgi:hypothetical protein